MTPTVSHTSTIENNISRQKKLASSKFTPGNTNVEPLSENMRGIVKTAFLSLTDLDRLNGIFFHKFKQN